MLNVNDLRFIGDFGNDGITRLQGAQDAIASVVTDGTLAQEASFGLALWAKKTSLVSHLLLEETELNPLHATEMVV